MTDKIWIEDPNILVQNDRLQEFFPRKVMTLEERINAISRGIIYIGICISLYQGNAHAAQYTAFLLFVIYVMWKFKKGPVLATVEETLLENYTNSVCKTTECTEPTINNPFMNYLVGDSNLKPPACAEPGYQQMAENLLNKQLYENAEDLYDKQAYQFQFYTNPSRERIPDTTKLANWLVGGVSNCKEDGICSPFEDLRYHKSSDPYGNTVQGFNF
jgi:hypothetical protein